MLLNLNRECCVAVNLGNHLSICLGKQQNEEWAGRGTFRMLADIASSPAAERWQFVAFPWLFCLFKTDMYLSSYRAVKRCV
jgi:hypothetical protein